jgi:hypothetical protein
VSKRIKATPIEREEIDIKRLAAALLDLVVEIGKNPTASPKAPRKRQAHNNQKEPPV